MCCCYHIIIVKSAIKSTALFVIIIISIVVVVVVVVELPLMNFEKIESQLVCIANDCKCTKAGTTNHVKCSCSR